MAGVDIPAQSGKKTLPYGDLLYSDPLYWFVLGCCDDESQLGNDPDRVNGLETNTSARALPVVLDAPLPRCVVRIRKDDKARADQALMRLPDALPFPTFRVVPGKLKVRPSSRPFFARPLSRPIWRKPIAPKDALPEVQNYVEAWLNSHPTADGDGLPTPQGPI